VPWICGLKPVVVAFEAPAVRIASAVGVGCGVLRSRLDVWICFFSSWNFPRSGDEVLTGLPVLESGTPVAS
jgi:hypothetical protein